MVVRLEDLEGHERAALVQAVSEAAMALYRVERITNDTTEAYRRSAKADLTAACARLYEFEKEHPHG